jgi:uncharacterized oxidoreductase
MKLKDQTILITGGGSGIGLALAEAFHKLGNQVIVSGRSPEKLRAAEAKGLSVLTGDMTNAESVAALAAAAIAKFPKLNAVIHSAGIMVNEKLTRGDSAKVATDTVLTNILGPILLNQALIPHFLKQESAMIMTVSSGLAFLPLAMTPTYCASKAAIHSYTESLRYQLRNTPVEVKELVPPYVRTSLMGERQASDARAMPLEAYVEEVMAILQRDPATEEIVVENARPLRDASYGGRAAYDELFNQRNDAFLAARKKEWDAL